MLGGNPPKKARIRRRHFPSASLPSYRVPRHSSSPSLWTIEDPPAYHTSSSSPRPDDISSADEADTEDVETEYDSLARDRRVVQSSRHRRHRSHNYVDAILERSVHALELSNALLLQPAPVSNITVPLEVDEHPEPAALVSFAASDLAAERVALRMARLVRSVEDLAKPSVSQSAPSTTNLHRYMTSGTPQRRANDPESLTRSLRHVSHSTSGTEAISLRSDIQASGPTSPSTPAYNLLASIVRRNNARRLSHSSSSRNSIDAGCGYVDSLASTQRSTKTYLRRTRSTEQLSYAYPKTHLSRIISPRFFETAILRTKKQQRPVLAAETVARLRLILQNDLAMQEKANYSSIGAGSQFGSGVPLKSPPLSRSIRSTEFPASSASIRPAALQSVPVVVASLSTDPVTANKFTRGATSRTRGDRETERWTWQPWRNRPSAPRFARD